MGARSKLPEHVLRANAVRKVHPDVFARIRAACQLASPEIDLDEHAARITLQVVIARAKHSQHNDRGGSHALDGLLPGRAHSRMSPQPKGVSRECQ